MRSKLLKYLTVAVLLAPVAAVAADFNDNTETPGKKIARRGAEVFQVEKFNRVFGAPIVEGWGIDWSILGDADIPVTDPTKRNNLRMLLSKIEQVEQRPEGYANIFLEVHDVSGAMKRVHKSRLSEVVHDYFSDLFPSSTITSQMKMNGVQMGEILFIEEPNGSKHKFYVKTHSKGTLSSQSTAAKRVNVGELLIYKIMEKLGIGCEVHFCSRSPEDVYIATRDAHASGVFHLFEQAIKDEEGVGSKLWGDLGALNRSPRENDWDRVEASLATDIVAQNFVEQIATVDVLSRILRMHDLLNNADNFGFVGRHLQAFTACIIDFRLSDDDQMRLNQNHFGGFLEGNGMFRYENAHRTTAFCLRHRSEEQRVKAAMKVLEEGMLKDFSAVIESAYDDVRGFLEEHKNEMTDCMPVLLDSLETMRLNFDYNYEFFLGCLRNWTPDQSHGASGSSG